MSDFISIRPSLQKIISFDKEAVGSVKEYYVSKDAVAYQSFLKNWNMDAEHASPVLEATCE